MGPSKLTQWHARSRVWKKLGTEIQVFPREVGFYEASYSCILTEHRLKTISRDLHGNGENFGSGFRIRNASKTGFNRILATVSSLNDLYFQCHLGWLRCPAYGCPADDDIARMLDLAVLCAFPCAIAGFPFRSTAEPGNDENTLKSKSITWK